MQIQSNLGSTIAMAFDECPPSLADRDYVQKSVERTTRWLARCKAEHRDTITGDVAFFLYGTLGFPFDLTEIMAEEAGLKVDKAGFEKCLENAREEAKAVGVGCGRDE